VLMRYVSQVQRRTHAAEIGLQKVGGGPRRRATEWRVIADGRRPIWPGQGSPEAGLQHRRVVAVDLLVSVKAPSDGGLYGGLIDTCRI